MAFTVMPKTTISELKSMVRTRSSVSETVSIRLVFASKELYPDNKTLDDFGIEKASNIFLLLRLLGGATLQLKVLIKDNEERKVSVDPAITVLELKRVIYNIYPYIEVEYMELNCAGVRLVDSRKL